VIYLVGLVEDIESEEGMLRVESRRIYWGFGPDVFRFCQADTAKPWTFKMVPVAFPGDMRDLLFHSLPHSSTRYVLVKEFLLP